MKIKTNKTSTILTLILMMIISTESMAAWASNLQITSVKSQINGVVFILEDFSQSNFRCDLNYFFIEKSADNYDARVSFLLSAYMAEQAISVSYGGCQLSGIKTHIKAGSILLVR